MKPIFFALAFALAGVSAAQETTPSGPGEEIREIFRQIEKDMKEIDRLLLEAGSREAEGKMDEAAKNIEKLLRDSLDRQKKVSEAIDEILKKIPPDGSRGSGDPNSPDPKDSQPEGERERDRTPIDPGQKIPRNPDSPLPDQEKGENRKADPPQRPPADPARNENVGGRWGDLPPLLQELFRNESTDEIPIRYRKKIEDYYRRVNEAKRP